MQDIILMLSQTPNFIYVVGGIFLLGAWIFVASAMNPKSDEYEFASAFFVTPLVLGYGLCALIFLEWIVKTVWLAI
jgi:hypothetical protein